MNNYCVYKHTSPSGKIYVGITSLKPELRWNGGRGYKNAHFTSAIQKYGWSNFKHEIVCEGLNKEEAEAMEIELIAKYKSNEKEFGYNIASGGNITNGMLGKHHKEETKIKMSLAQKGKIFTEEHKQRIGEAHKGKLGIMLGKHHSLKTRSKLSELKKGNKCRAKKVKQYDLKGNFIKIWDSANEASKSLGITTVKAACRGVQKTAGGYCWEYMNLKGGY